MGSWISMLSGDDPERQLTANYLEIFNILIGNSTQPHRLPPLPFELARYICHLADFSVPYRLLTITSPPEKPFYLHSFSATGRQRRLWFVTPPITKRLIVALSSVRLVTRSKHQGFFRHDFKSDGSHSWWEVGLLRGSDWFVPGMDGMQAADKSNDSNNKRNRRPSLHWDSDDVNDKPELQESLFTKNKDSKTKWNRWTTDLPPDRPRHDELYDIASPVPIRSFVSHYHGVKRHIGGEGYLTLRGRCFGPDHEIWGGCAAGLAGCHLSGEMIGGRSSHTDGYDDDDDADGGPLRVGDRFGVFGCAEDRCWACYGQWARLEFEVFWEPKRVKARSGESKKKSSIEKKPSILHDVNAKLELELERSGCQQCLIARVKCNNHSPYSHGLCERCASKRMLCVKRDPNR